MLCDWVAGRAHHSSGENDYRCTAGQCSQRSATQERERGRFAVDGMLPHLISAGSHLSSLCQAYSYEMMLSVSKC